MSKIQSSPPLFGQQHEDDKEQLRSIIIADAQRDSQTPSPPGKLDFNDMSSTSRTKPQAGATSASAIATEAAVENDDEIEVEPSEELQIFDWEELQEQYHHMIQERGDVEDGLLTEFTELMNFFTTWSETTQGHEVDRSFKRIKTRIHHVQASEEQFEEKRKHYMSVVNAFKSALALLNQP